MDIPLELHKVRIVQKLNLVPIERRRDAIKEAGYNTFKLGTKDVFLDMLTDSGTNAISDNQLSAMMRADDRFFCSTNIYISLQVHHMPVCTYTAKDTPTILNITVNYNRFTI